jgi:hypothetical protein
LNVSLKAIALAAYLALIQELARTDSGATVGIVANGRSERLSDPLSSLGLFWNMLPFAAIVPAAPGSGWIAQVQAQLSAIEPHTLYPLAQIEAMHGSRELFFASFNFTNFHNVYAPGQDSDLQILDAGGRDRFDYPLGFLFGIDQGLDSVTLHVTIDQRFFDQDDAPSLAQRYLALLDGLLARSESEMN